jgi:hypothetical protein
MTPANERKAAERQRRKEAGLVRVEVWLPSEAVQTFKAMAERTARNYTLARETSQPLTTESP